MIDTQAKIVLETALLCASQPMPLAELRKLFGGDDEVDGPRIRAALVDLQEQWADRGMTLVELAGGWRFQSRPDMQRYLERLNPEKPPKYSRAVLETLAIVAWRQPVTRGDIEDIRGVTVSSQIVKALEDRGWIEVIGHRDAPGRPALFGTTRQFLDDLGLKALDELPELESTEAVSALAGLDFAEVQAIQVAEAGLLAENVVSQPQEFPEIPGALGGPDARMPHAPDEMPAPNAGAEVIFPLGDQVQPDPVTTPSGDAQAAPDSSDSPDGTSPFSADRVSEMHTEHTNTAVSPASPTAQSNDVDSGDAGQNDDALERDSRHRTSHAAVTSAQPHIEPDGDGNAASASRSSS